MSENIDESETTNSEQSSSADSDRKMATRVVKSFLASRLQSDRTKRTAASVLPNGSNDSDRLWPGVTENQDGGFSNPQLDSNNNYMHTPHQRENGDPQPETLRWSSRSRLSRESEYLLEDYNLVVKGPGARIISKKINEGILESRDFCEFRESPCRKNLGIPRKEMPQLRDDVVWNFIDVLEENGIDVKPGDTPVGRLKATQREINAEKVSGMLEAVAAGNLSFGELGDEIIISNDDYILDGHHRWATLLVHDPHNTMSTLQVDLPMKRLLELANNFEGVEQETFEEGIAAARRRVRQALRAYSNAGRS